MHDFFLNTRIHVTVCANTRYTKKFIHDKSLLSYIANQKRSPPEHQGIAQRILLTRER